MSLGESFESVVAAARAGQEWAWELIYRELSPSVLGYLRARGAVEPEDLTGEVFVQIVRDLGRFEGGEQDFRAWVFTIAHHRLVDDGRRRGRRPLAGPAEALAEDEVGGDAEAEALARIDEQWMRSLLRRLSEDQQSVLLLRVLGDLTVEQPARVLGRSQGAVKALQRRGLAALRWDLAKLGVTL
jgi:RNA polymerase sigma factor (sigma-70 family)